MGTRGPKPMPASVHRMRGNPAKKTAAELTEEFRPDVEIPDCPRILWPEAKKHWRFLTQELWRYGLIARVDRAQLAFGCQEWARWMWAEQKIHEKNDADPKGEAGLIEVSQSGYRMQSVYLQISTKSREAYQRVVDGFGLEPAARARVTPSNNYPYLPGMEPEATAGNDKKITSLADFAQNRP